MATKKVSKRVQFIGTGRRKSAVARVRLLEGGEGKIVINKRTIDEYFPLDTTKLIVNQPLELTNTKNKFDVVVNVRGGGITGQAGAIRHGIARALCVVDAEAYRSEQEIQDVRKERNTDYTKHVKHHSSVRDSFQKLANASFFL